MYFKKKKKRPLIKFCGLKNKEDFLKCVYLNVYAVGFIFYKKSKRFVNFKKVKKILSNYKHNFPKKIGVFCNPNYSFIKKVNKNLNLDFFQICGNKINKKIKKKIKHNNKYIRSFGIYKENFVNVVKKINNSKKKIFFVDNFCKNGGGTGNVFLWRYINLIEKKIFVSGGINLGNIKNLILSYKPFGIDISSGIEKKNKKSFSVMKKIVNLVNGI
ncbi:phosphoribosylanthranilate isomerase [Candidatus Vidania fulgoroideorum]